MQLSSTLAWLVDAAAETPGADRLLAEISARLVADGVPLAGGALTLAVPHPLIARRTWLWRADSGEVIEAFGFAAEGLPAAGGAGPHRGWGSRRRGSRPRERRARTAMRAGVGSPVWRPASCMRTTSGRGRTGLRSAGS